MTIPKVSLKHWEMWVLRLMFVKTQIKKIKYSFLYSDCTFISVYYYNPLLLKSKKNECI